MNEAKWKWSVLTAFCLVPIVVIGLAAVAAGYWWIAYAGIVPAVLGRFAAEWWIAWLQR